MPFLIPIPFHSIVLPCCQSPVRNSDNFCTLQYSMFKFHLRRFVFGPPSSTLLFIFYGGNSYQTVWFPWIFCSQLIPSASTVWKVISKTRWPLCTQFALSATSSWTHLVQNVLNTKLFDSIPQLPIPQNFIVTLGVHLCQAG